MIDAQYLEEIILEYNCLEKAVEWKRKVDASFRDIRFCIYAIIVKNLCYEEVFIKSKLLVLSYIPSF